MSEVLESVLSIARIGGSAALELFARGRPTRMKADGSPVTDADIAAEEAMRAAIQRRHPDDGILGEECGAFRPDARRRWTLDPIDGTKAFVTGVPNWATLVALIEDDRILAGCAFFPVLREWIGAARGHGCWWNGSRCQVSEIAHLRAASVLTTGDRLATNPRRGDRWRALTQRVAAYRTWGDAYGYMLLAIGRVECMVDDELGTWDWTPFVPIIEEAGGVITDWQGGNTGLDGGVIATNAKLASEIRAILRE